jgi:hypothetical protein
MRKCERGWAQHPVICPTRKINLMISAGQRQQQLTRHPRDERACEPRRMGRKHHAEQHPSRLAEDGSLLRMTPKPLHAEGLCRLYKSPLGPRSHSYPRMRIFARVGGDERIRKTSHDEDDYFGRIADGAGCDLRTGVGGYHCRECGASCPCFGQRDRDARLRCGGAGDRRAECAPLSRRTESQRLRKSVRSTMNSRASASSCHFRTRPRIPQAPIAAINSEISTL